MHERNLRSHLCTLDIGIMKEISTLKPNKYALEKNSCMKP